MFSVPRQSQAQGPGSRNHGTDIKYPCGGFSFFFNTISLEFLLIKMSLLLLSAILIVFDFLPFNLDNSEFNTSFDFLFLFELVSLLLGGKDLLCLLDFFFDFDLLDSFYFSNFFISIGNTLFISSTSNINFEISTLKGLIVLKQ